MGAGRKILVVEDEPVVALSIKYTLQQWKFDAGVVASGEEALEYVAREQPDVLLMDIRLKGSLDGVDTATQLSAGTYRPVIFLTAFADSEMVERIKNIPGYAGYLTKPFDNAELKAMIDRALKKK
ncbi:MAG TPA: response regulator [Candidatus Omnitrophota bacterium]|nr:response regulator [Candidatus Omnitrophota bacterium]HRZ14417.1 response regulator [Candidatus Omnitrophota bacterium]